MTETIAIARLPASPRKRNAEATRAAILEAAKAQFALLGYDCAVLRDIAREAGVDVALVKRYFGGKEALFVEALKASFGPDGARDWDRTTFAHEMATMLADSPHVDEARTHRFQFLLRAAISPTTAPLLNVLVHDRFLEPIRQWLGGADADARARVLAASYIGFLVERLIRGDALQGREREVFIERVTAIFAVLVTDIEPQQGRNGPTV
ncbi:TetR/AcrR family transcriptional regulator [Phenylobacterium sp.]|jgi:AcrR family transcriptional regulator|uniref:TetR/AcrR family transcriptional regulator n=1 Tax=Phenylobacterium sp. TaxID=1871053 RepID=UPI0025DCB301|nr:TetR/AcrR family transcriptional regulator [Phenylobacterium sp.]